MLKPVVIIIEQSPTDTDAARVMTAVTNSCIEDFLRHIELHGEEIYQQLINAPPIHASFDWFMAPPITTAQSNVDKEGAD